MHIPFDNVALAAIALEIQDYCGAHVQDVRQPNDHTITLALYKKTSGEKGVEGVLLFSAHPEFARTHFTTRRLPNAPSPPTFCATLRARLQAAELTQVDQIASDRILCLTFSGEKGEHFLIAELMGKHSNLILLDEFRRVISACKWVPASKSRRPIVSGVEYRWPPVIDSDVLELASPKTPRQWTEFSGLHPKQTSSFFKLLVENDLIDGDWGGYYVYGLGAYPLDPSSVFPAAVGKPSFSVAVEQHFSLAEAQYQLENLRSSLLGQLDRVLLARDAAIREMEETLLAGQKAGKWQRLGELILAYGPSAPLEIGTLTVYDYDGALLDISVDPALTFQENARRYFDLAKKAKSRAGTLSESAERLRQERVEVSTLRTDVAEAKQLAQLQTLQEKAKTRRWLMPPKTPKAKEDRPYEGHRIREVLGPGGFTILYGENAESNDYLTLRVAKPNDYWLHVRGSNSAHVVLQTGNKPERVGKEHLSYAAKLAVQHSPSKHAGYVPVDYTLKKYVRKPKGSAPGAALYTNEKTLHIES